MTTVKVKKRHGDSYHEPKTRRQRLFQHQFATPSFFGQRSEPEQKVHH